MQRKKTKLGRRTAKTAGPSAVELARIALDLFADRHFDSVTIKDVGNAANVNSAMIYYHYKDKMALFNASINSAIQEAFEMYSEHLKEESHKNPILAINAWIDMHVTLNRRLRNVVKISMHCSEPEYQEARLAINLFYAHESSILQEKIRSGIDTGIFREIDPLAIATMISAFLDGVLARSLILPNFDVATTVAEFKSSLWLYLKQSPSV